MRTRPLPTQARLIELFGYNPETGAIVRRKNGRTLGNPFSKGYRHVHVDGKVYLAHRVVWKIAMGFDPPAMLDHVNGDKSDNRICNLRPVTNTQNLRNRSAAYRNSQTGVLGVHLTKSGRYAAQIRAGKTRHIGTFTRLEDAAAARRRAELDQFGEYAPHRDDLIVAVDMV